MKKWIFIASFFSVCWVTAQESHVPTSLKQAQTMVWVKGGETTIGNSKEADAMPLFTAQVKGFWIQKYEVTNAQFKTFVKATGYKTLAENQGGAYVFLPHHPKDSTSLPSAPWWHFVKGANWKHPEGGNSTLNDKMWYPVVQIAYKDALAYCKWANLRLPTEVEREYAARKNGIVQHKNIWEGNFPYTNANTDGYLRTAPVGSFSAGKLNLFDMQGNVWEWCKDPYNENAYHYAKETNPPSNQPLVPRYFDENSPNVETRVIRGGSFLCAKNYCKGYVLGRRMRSSVNTAFEHIGFRCVKSQ